MSESKVRALELENARLRGANEALEKILAAYRAERTPVVWPWMQPAAPPPAPVQPTILPPTNGHGGCCACPQCMARWTVVTCETRPSLRDAVIGGPERPAWDRVIGGPQIPGGTYGSSS